MHRFINDLERPVNTYLLGRRLHEVMISWETVALAWIAFGASPRHMRVLRMRAAALRR